jgi:hypothetical protein
VIYVTPLTTVEELDQARLCFTPKATELLHGHATAPLKIVMNSRRLMEPVLRPRNKLYIKLSDRGGVAQYSKTGLPMSQSGQSRRFACAGRMSVLTPIATEIAICGHVG